MKQRFPGVPVVTYVNTYADVKAESDICCTSSNAAAVVESLGVDTVIFLPDEYLAKNVARETGKHVIFPTVLSQPAAPAGVDYQLIGWHGRCEVHEQFQVDDIRAIRQQFPDVIVLAHPECSPEVVAAADFSGSTTAMIKYVERTLRAPLPAADRVRDGRQRGGGQPGEGNAAAVQRAVPAHEPDHDGGHAPLPPAHAVRDRRPGGDPGAGGARGRAHADDRLTGRPGAHAGPLTGAAMPDARVNGARLHYTVTGEGFPLVFVHEFAGDGRSWDPQVRFFARRYRVVTYHARGYPPSDVPEDPAAYSQDIAVADLHGLLRHLGIAQAHLCGLSMGASTVLHLGLRHPEMARSLVVAGCGSGSDDPEGFAARLRGARADDRARRHGGVRRRVRAGARRACPFRRKDPQGWGEFRDAFVRHSGPGSARTLRGVQARRPAAVRVRSRRSAASRCRR